MSAVLALQEERVKHRRGLLQVRQELDALRQELDRVGGFGSFSTVGVYEQLDRVFAVVEDLQGAARELEWEGEL